MTVSDAIRPETWVVNVGTTENQIVTHCNVEFKHLSLTTIETLRSVLEREPEISRRSSQLKTEWDSVKWSFRSTLDLSRNFFVDLDLSEAISVITKRLSDYVDLESSKLFLDNLRSVCLASNDLEYFPSFPILPHLEEVYINHNHIQSIKSPNSSPCANKSSDPAGSNFRSTKCAVSSSWTFFCPKLRLVDLRNNLLESIPGLYLLLDQHAGIQHLSLSCNRLVLDSLSDLPNCPNLRILGLFSNYIDNSINETPIEGLMRLLKLLVAKFPILQDLYLLGNPITDKIDHETYKATVTSIFQQLQYLDGQLV